MPRAVRQPAKRQMTEADLQAAVMDCAQVLGWFAFHPWISVNSNGGYPDTTLVHPRQKRLLWAELKGPRGKVSDAQLEWGAAIEAAGGEWHLWTPAEWHDGTIEAVLKGEV